MSDSTAVPVLVQSVSRDSVEALNSLLRNAGVAAHCTWIPAVQNIAEALEQLQPELLVSFGPATRELTELAAARDKFAPAVPLIVVREQLSAATTGEDMASGARDTVAVDNPAHLTAVIRRELRAARLERTLTMTLTTAQDYRRQLETLLNRSNDAIAQVQEGIVVQVNDSWLELLGHTDPGALIGQPVMDLFNAESQAPLKGAMAACLLGQWSDHLLKAGALSADGSTVALELLLHASEFESEPCVQLIVPAHKRDDRQLERELADALCRDATTGLWLRRHLLRLCSERLVLPPAGGLRCLALVQIDKFEALARDLGATATEEFLTLFPAQVSAMLGPNDVAGHFGTASLLLLLERGNARDAEAWSESLVERIGKHAFQIGQRQVKVTCSIGLAPIANAVPQLDRAIAEAQGAARRGTERGGNRVMASKRVEQDERVLAYDQVWVKHIKAALIENRFHLVHHPVASLSSNTQKIFDVAVRMLDSQGREVLPSEFLAAAERNDLLRPIDRWVLGAALKFIAKSQPDQLFVRLSRDSALDPKLMKWLDAQLKSTGAEPQRLCVQVAEEVTEFHLEEMQRLFGELHERRIRCALERFGAGNDSLGLLGLLPVDFLKIDGSLMQGIGGDAQLQQRVRGIVDVASRSGIQTVAERIEDANTMAVVWQLGVQYIQGYLVHAPEEVVLKS